jgi:outer membrane lipoprotein-sorting protein
MQIYKKSAFLCIFFVCLAFGQNVSKERQIWERLQKNMEQGVSGEFRLTKNVAKISKEFVSQGSFSVSKKDGVIWETKTPFQDKNVFPMKKLREYFSGDFDELTEKFNLKLNDDGLTDTLTLVPKEKSIREVIISVVMLIKGEHLQNCKIIWANNDYAFYEFMVP